MTSEVIVQVDGGVMEITLNRPEARNAINENLAVLLGAALDELNSNDQITVAIISGAGGNFCAGADLKELAKTGGFSKKLQEGMSKITTDPPEKPIIAAIEGFAVAGGTEMAMNCDIIVAASNARFGIPEVKRGLIAAGGALVSLQNHMSLKAAMELALTGDIFDANRAKDLGLINHVTEPGESVAVAREIAVTIAKNGPFAVKQTKKLLKAALDWSESEKWERQGEYVGPVFASEDAVEGPTAFAEKREPVWKGK